MHWMYHLPKLWFHCSIQRQEKLFLTKEHPLVKKTEIFDQQLVHPLGYRSIYETIPNLLRAIASGIFSKLRTARETLVVPNRKPRKSPTRAGTKVPVYQGHFFHIFFNKLLLQEFSFFLKLCRGCELKMRHLANYKGVSIDISGCLVEVSKDGGLSSTRSAEDIPPLDLAEHYPYPK